MSCCSLDQNERHLVVQAVAIEGTKIKKNKKYHLRGYTYTPATFADRFCRFLQWVEISEKVTEIADELFHLFRTLLEKFTNSKVYQTFHNLHHAAHDIEHVLHSFCFLGDVFRLTLEIIQKVTGKELCKSKFFEYNKDKKVDYVGSTARISHAFSHFLATAAFLSELDLFQFRCLKNIFKYIPFFSAAGYVVGAISLIWHRHEENLQVIQTKEMCSRLKQKISEINKRCVFPRYLYPFEEKGLRGYEKQLQIATEQLEKAKKEQQRQLIVDLSIQITGCLFALIPLTKTIRFLVPYAHYLTKLSAIAGIIHASCVLYRLLPQKTIFGHFVLSDSDVLETSPHISHDDDHKGHHHVHSLKFYPV